MFEKIVNIFSITATAATVSRNSSKNNSSESLYLSKREFICSVPLLLPPTLPAEVFKNEFVKSVNVLERESQYLQYHCTVSAADTACRNSQTLEQSILWKVLKGE